jgi:hypothetical protein
LKILPDWRWSHSAVCSAHALNFFAIFFHPFGVIVILCSLVNSSQAQSPANATWSVTLVLPPKVVAGKPATLAVFGADGKLASGVTVEVARDLRVMTDTTGRATFTAPSDGGVVIAKASGRAAAALVDPDTPADGSQTISVAPVISLKDSFSICGTGFRGEAGANRVKINEERALILAASPECLVVQPGPKVVAGPVSISVQTGEAHWAASTTVVSLEFEPPQPALVPEKKSRLVVRADGTDQPLRIVVENETPGVLEFLRGDVQRIRTSGGRNDSTIDVQAIRSGVFSFHARVLPPPDVSIAERYLRAAVPFATKDLQHRLQSLADRLARHPRDADKVQHELEQIVSATIAGDLRTLLESANAAL